MASISIDASGDSRQNNDSSDSDDEHLLPDFIDNFREFVADNDSEDGDLDDDLSDGGHGGDFSVPGNVAEEGDSDGAISNEDSENTIIYSRSSESESDMEVDDSRPMFGPTVIERDSCRHSAREMGRGCGKGRTRWAWQRRVQPAAGAGWGAIRPKDCLFRVS